MEINPEKMSTETETLIYEQPSLKKYGTMKELTFSSSGSGGDAMGKAGDPGGVPNDTSDPTMTNPNQPDSMLNGADINKDDIGPNNGSGLGIENGDITVFDR